LAQRLQLPKFRVGRLRHGRRSRPGRPRRRRLRVSAW
jgi:hypothetical protein